MAENQAPYIGRQASIRSPERAMFYDSSYICELEDKPWINTWTTVPLPSPKPSIQWPASSFSQPIKVDNYVDYLLWAVTFITTFSNVAILARTNSLAPNITSDLQSFTAHLTALVFSPSMASTFLTPKSLSSLLKLLVYPIICLVAGQLSAHKGHGKKGVVLVSMATQILLFIVSAVLLTLFPPVPLPLVSQVPHQLVPQVPLPLFSPGSAGRYTGLALAEAAYALQVVAVRPLSKEINTVFFTGSMADLLSDKNLWKGLRSWGSVPSVRRRAGMLILAVVGAAVGQAVGGAAGMATVLWVGVGLRVAILFGMWYADTETGLPK